jgi:hypothetical protein
MSPLGVDDQTGDVVEKRFLEDRDAQTRLSRASHADDDAMRGEIGTVIDKWLFGLTGLEPDEQMTLLDVHPPEYMPLV